MYPFLESKLNPVVFNQFYYASHAMFTLIGPGMSIGWSAVALPLLTEIDETGRNEAILHGNPSAATWFASLLAFAGPLGCFLNTFLMKIGRKLPMAIVGYVCTLGWLVTATSHSVEQLIIGRFIVGISTGLVSVPATVYIAEISTPKYRLSLINGNSLTISIGIMLIYFLGYLIPNWRTQAIISMVIPLLSASSILLLIPESPVWLLASNRPQKAKESLMKIRGLKIETSELHQELNEMQLDCETQSQRTELTPIAADFKGNWHTAREPPSWQRKIQQIWRILLLPEVWKPLLILHLLFVFQQFCGYHSLLTFSVEFISHCGLSADPFVITAILGVIQLIACFVLVCTSHKLGVRKILLISIIGMAISFAILGLHIHFIKPHDPMNNYQAIAIICLCIFMAAGSYGLMAMPWSMVGELYPTDYVHYLAPLTTCMADVFNFMTIQSYPALIAYGFVPTIGVYCAVLIAATIFVCLAVPETLGVPHHEIVERFQRQ